MIKAAPTFIRKLDRAVDVDEGEPLELKCVVEGSPLPVVSWLKDGQLIEPSDRYVCLEYKYDILNLILLHLNEII